MTISVDTGFILALRKRYSLTLEVWKKVLDKKDELVVSVLVLSELYRLYLKAGKPQEGREVVESLKRTASIKGVDEELSLSAASLSHREGIPLVDSLILCTAKKEKAKRFYSSDRRHFEPISSHLRKQIKIIFV